MRKLFYLLIVVSVGFALISCKPKKVERKQIRIDYPEIGYLKFYADDMTVAEPYNEFGINSHFSYFNLKSSSTRKGWDCSETGFLNPAKKVIMPPFYFRVVAVWDPVVREYYFFGSWKNVQVYHVYDYSGNFIAKFRLETFYKLKKIKKELSPWPKSQWEIKNFKSKI